jgi:anti-sigma factor RsiW
MMISCKKYQSHLAAKAFGDLGATEERELQTHLAACAACRDTLAEMQQALGTIGMPQRPEMPEHFWEGYWHRLTQRMEKEAQQEPKPDSLAERVWEWLREKWSRQPLLVPLARTAGVLALLMLGVVIGHYWWPQETPPVAEVTPPPVVAMPAQASQWLDRSKILLVGIMNEDLSGAGQIDFSHQRAASRRLITEAQAVARELDPSAHRQLIQLMSQLELILLQIANLEAEHDLSAVELVREGIDREGLLLKINIAEIIRQAPPNRAAGMPATNPL